MPAIPLTDLIERTRLESGLRSNQYYDNDQIVRGLNSGGSELYDLFTVENQKYVIAEYEFTVTGPEDAVLPLPDDFQQGHSLEINPNFFGGVFQPQNQPRTIKYLSNWLNRNEAGGTNGVFIGVRDPVYAIVDSNLRFYPPNALQPGQYKLYYTPTWTTLALQTTVSWTVDASTNVESNAGLIQYNFTSTPLAHPAFVDAMLGGTVTVAFTGMTNSPYNCVASTITGPDPVSAGNAIVSSQAWPGAGFTNPAAGTASISYDAAGTRSTLPSLMGPWSEYLVVYAAIQINLDRQRDVSDLERKLERLKARVISTLAIREEEPQQPPLTRSGGTGWDGYGGNW